MHGVRDPRGACGGGGGNMREGYVQVGMASPRREISLRRLCTRLRTFHSVASRFVSVSVRSPPPGDANSHTTASGGHGGKWLFQARQQSQYSTQKRRRTLQSGGVNTLPRKIGLQCIGTLTAAAGQVRERRTWHVDLNRTHGLLVSFFNQGNFNYGTIESVSHRIEVAHVILT